MPDRDHENMQLVSLRSSVWKKVQNVPGILGIGIGLKEVGGIPSDQISWRLYVRKKLPKNALRPEYIFPPSFFGIPTDVIPKAESRITYGEDTVTLLRPGVVIGSDAGSSGTLGCFAIRRGQPDKIVILSNSHVVYSDSGSLGMTSDMDIGQPKVSCSWCCKCKVIGNAKRADANNAFGPWVETQVQGFANQRGVLTDCAIADFNKKRDYTNNIENVGMITGTPPAGSLGLNSGDSVEMIGSTSGYVKGKVLTFTFNAQIVGGAAISNLLYPCFVEGTSVSENFAGVYPNINQLVFIPDPDRDNAETKTYFARHGDSGSVIVNSARQVVALLSRAWVVGENTADNLNPYLASPLPAHVGSMGIANPIYPVLDHLSIEIPNNLQGTKVSSGNTISVPSAESEDIIEVDADLWLSRKADELEVEVRTFSLGREVADKINQHRPEVFQLVNHARPVTLTWHRNKGPAFVAHCLRSVKEPDHEMPFEIEGISRELLIKRMANVLKEHGSDALCRDIDRWYHTVIRHINHAKKIEEFVELMKSLSKNDRAEITTTVSS